VIPYALAAGEFGPQAAINAAFFAERVCVGGISMKRIICTALLCVSVPALAQTQATASPKSAAQASTADRIICRQIEEIGSRLGGKRVCMTQQQWEEQRRHTQEDVDDANRHRR
jgi:hypothetical protein